MKNDHVANVILICLILIPFASVINILNWTDQYGTIKNKIGISICWIFFIIISILGVK